MSVVKRNLRLACEMKEFNIKFSERLRRFHIKIMIILLSVFNFERIEIDISEKIDHFLCDVERIFVCFIS